MNNLIYSYWLCNIPGIGRKTIKKLLEAGDARRLFHISEKEVSPLLGKKQLQSFLYTRTHLDPAREYDKLAQRGIRFVPATDPDFPEHLKGIPDPPSALYCLGKLPDEKRPSVAIIGARMCSEYGRYGARLFGKALAEAGVQVISGMARGVDGISQKGALAGGGTSFAVLGCGVDYCYPEDNWSLYNSLKENGGILSEYPPGTAPEARLFPPRNRIISGLSDLVLVIEAKKRSGTLITVDMALEQGREVFALPGRISDRLSDGCNSLIRQGAGIALSPEDILEYFYGKREQVPPAADQQAAGDMENEEIPSPRYKRSPDDMDDLNRKILSLIDINPISVDTLYDKITGSGFSITLPVLMNRLIDLCLKDLLEQRGGSFCRKLSS